MRFTGIIKYYDLVRQAPQEICVSFDASVDTKKKAAAAAYKMIPLYSEQVSVTIEPIE